MMKGARNPMALEYTVVWGLYVGELLEKVAEHLDDGWEPQGGVSVAVMPATTYDPAEERFYQALAR